MENYNKQCGTKIDSQFEYVKHSLFLYYYFLITVLFAIQTTVNLLAPPCMCIYVRELISPILMDT